MEFTARPKSTKRLIAKRIGVTLNSKRVAPYVFVLPFVLTFLIFFLYPILSTMTMSFQSVNIGDIRFIGFSNYEKLLNSSTFPIAIGNTLIYTALTLALLIPVPLILACLLNAKSMVGSSFFRGCLFVPLLCSVVVAGITFRFMFNETDNALVNSLFINVLGGEKVRWLSLRWPAMAVLLTLACWRWTGINIVYFLSGLRSISTELYEACDIDGANTLQRFWHITVPSLKPTFVYVLTISIYGGLAMFTESQMLWGGKSTPNNIGLTIVGFIYQNGISKGDLGYASSAGLILLAAVLFVNLLQLRATGVLGKGKEG